MHKVKNLNIDFSFSIMIETENLGMASLDDLRASLNSLKKQVWINEAKEIVILAGSHVNKDLTKLLKKEYPWLSINIITKSVDYIDVKLEAIEMAKSDVVVLIDSDVQYQPNWLVNLLTVFLDQPDATISSGDTRAMVRSGYSMACNLCWMFLISPNTTGLTRVPSFAFNNFAIKKQSYIETKFPNRFPLYRGKGTFVKRNLIMNGGKIYRTSKALAYHAVPGNFREWWYRMLINGHDYVAMADFSYQNRKVVEKFSLPKRFLNLILWLGWKFVEIPRSALIMAFNEPKSIRFLPQGLLLAYVNYSVMCIGSIITLFYRDYLYEVVSDYEQRDQV